MAATGAQQPNGAAPGATARVSPLSVIAHHEASRNDGWQNMLTGLGNYNRDKRMAMHYAPDFRLDQETLDMMFSGDDMVKLICELVPREMVREWVELSGDPDNKILTKADQLGVRNGFYEAQTWARLQGGAVIVMGADDGQKLDQPLNEDRVKAFDWITVLDRWDIQIATRYADPTKANFDEPATYRIATASVSMPATADATVGSIIHESRILRFDGALTTRRRKRYVFEGWCQSVIDACYPAIRDFNQAFGGISHMMTDYSQTVVKIKNLAQMLLSNQDKDVVKRFQYMDMSRSVARALMLDADGEDFSRESINLTGVADVISKIASRLSASTGIPITLLMGESPGGLNATGESDHRFWYNIIAYQQETRFRKPLARIFKLIGKVLGIKPSDETTGSYAFEFKSLWQASESDQEDTRLKVAQRDQIYLANGVLDAAEVAVSRFGGDKYSAETQIDIKAIKGQGYDPDADGDDDSNDPADVNDPANPAPVPGSPGVRGTPAPTKDVQKLALNGAQGQALQAMLVGVGDKSLDPDAAILAIELMLPDADEDKISKMVKAQTRVEAKSQPAPIIVPGAGNGQPPKDVPSNPKDMPPKD